MKKKTIISLFSGAGGLDIGFMKSGHDIIWANDFNKDACDSYKENIGNHIVCGSIYDVKNHLPKTADILIGGPPCQGFSVAGKMDPNDPRSELIWAYCDTLEAVKPKAFVMENVKALGSLVKWEDIRNRLLERFKNAGYSVDYIVLNAKDYGVPQSRERVFFIGFRGDIDWSIDEVKKYQMSPGTVIEALSHLGRAGSENNPITCTAKITFTSNPVMRKSPYAGMLFNGLGRPIRLHGVSQTLPASMGGNKTPIIDENELYNGETAWIIDYHAKLMKKTINPNFGLAPSFLRRMTINEAAAIQTFPSDYRWKGAKTSIYKQIGNAVPPQLAHQISLFVDEILDKNQIK